MFISPYFPCQHKHETSNTENKTSNPIHKENFDSCDEEDCDDEYDEEDVKKPTPTIYDEFDIVLRRYAFIFLSFAYAGQAASLIGVSTFGASFLLGLGFFNHQTEASTIFGAVICIAGLVSTPIGGIILDRMLKTPPSEAYILEQQKIASEHSKPGSISIATSIESKKKSGNGLEMSNSLSTEPLVNKRKSSRVISSDNSIKDSNGEIPIESYFHTEHDYHHYKLHQITKFVMFFSFMGALFLILLYIVDDKILYLFSVLFGCGLIFLCNSAINMGVMLSVPVDNQPFSIGLNTVILHLFGDVPSPIIVGMIKDLLAPGCVEDEGSDDDNAAASDECRADSDGLKITMLITTLWLLWTPFCFLLAHYFNKYRWVEFRPKKVN